MPEIEFQGTGGGWEGDLNDADIKVNLDAALELDGSADYLKNSTADFRTDDAAGFITAWVRSDDWNRGTQQHWFSATDEATGNYYIRTFFNTDGKLYIKCMDSSVVYDLKSTNAVTDDGNWHHIAVGSTGSAIKMFIDGIEETVVVSSGSNNGDWFGDLTDSKLDHVIVGALHDNAGVRSMFDGYIADVRYYSDSLSDAEIQILASKINATTPDIDNLQHWWKLNSATIDSSNLGEDFGDATDLDLTPTSIIASNIHTDEYYIDIRENSTATDGTVTVTQGKLEGKALSSLDFESDGEYGKVAFASTITQSHDNMSISCWIKRENATGQDDTILGKSDLPHHHYLQIDTDGDIRYKQYPNTLDTGAVVTDTDWHHIIVTLKGDNNGAIYLDGVTQVLATNSVTADGTFDQIGLRGDSGDGAATADEFDGLIRDVRFFDFALNADQAASLYSGSYPVIPKNYYKLDEGTGGNGETVADSGVGTTNTGTIGPAGHAPNWSNGTLDIDGSITIAANGTLSAPRGNLTWAGTAWESSGTFTHNNGTVICDNGADVAQVFQDSATGALSFYKLTSNRAASSYHMYIKGDITVEHTLLNSSGFVNLYGPNTLTLGTATSSGTFTATSSGLRFYDNDASNYAKLYGASEAHPFTYTGSEPDIDTYSTNASHVALKWGDIQVAMTSDYQGGVVRLDGDMEFDAVTVQNGDDFDLNGKRAEFSAAFTLASGPGQLKTTGGGLIVAHNNIQILGSAEGLHDGDVNVIVTGGTAHDWRNGAADGNAPWCRRMFVNGTVTHQDQLGASAGSQNYNPESVIVAGGKLTQSGGHAYLKNLTIAEGGDMEMTQSTQKEIHLDGDFTTSGGFIGKSGMVMSGDNNYEGMSVTELQAKGDWNFSGSEGITIEGWFKFDDLDFGTSGSNDAILVGHIRSGDTTGKRYGLGLQIWGDQVMAIAANNDTAHTHFDNCSFPVTDLTAGRWHHLAMTVDANDSATPVTKLYLDGRLKKQVTGVTEVYFGYNFVAGGYGDNHDGQNWDGRTMDGTIARVSCFRQEMTTAQIQSMMFTNYTEMAALSSGVDEAKAVGWWQFDEGNGTTVDNKGTAGAPPSSDHSNFDGTLSTTVQDLTCDLTNNDATVTCDSSAVIYKGMSVSSSVAGFPAGALVKTINSGTEGTNVTSFELSANFTGTTASNQRLQFTQTDLIPGTTAWASAGAFTQSSSIIHMRGSSKSINYTGDETINDLEIDAGQTTLNEITGSGTDTLTAGYVKIESGTTLTSTAGTLAVTDESAGGYAFENLGTFNHNYGKILVDYDTPNKNDNTDVKADTFNDFEIKMNGASYSVMPRDLSGSNTVEFLGDLTITQGKLDDNVNSDVYIIHGNTYVEANGSFGSAANWHTGNITHHGIVTLNGGTYYRSNAGGTVTMGGLRNVGGLIL